MVFEAGGPSVFNSDVLMDDNAVVGEYDDEDEEPNDTAKQFYSLMEAANQPLYPGNETHSTLSASFRMMGLKCTHQLTETCFNDISGFLQEVLPVDNNMPKDMYSTKKIIKELGLPVQTIHCCASGCMLFWEEDSELENCKFCYRDRYMPVSRTGTGKRIPVKKMHFFSIISRLQRLYASSATAGEMRWHAEHLQDPSKMCHPSDAEAWRHFDNVHPDFAQETRNVRLCLCSDGFQAFGAYD